MPEFTYHPDQLHESEWIAISDEHRHPRGVCRRTVWKWYKKGVRAKSGHTVKLPVFFHSNRRYYTLEGYAWFIREQQK